MWWQYGAVVSRIISEESSTSVVGKLLLRFHHGEPPAISSDDVTPPQSDLSLTDWFCSEESTCVTVINSVKFN